MSRIANNPINVPSGVEVTIDANEVKVKGAKGALSFMLNKDINLVAEDGVLKVSVKNNSTFIHALSGTTRSIINNMVLGVHTGFEKKLKLIGVGYRAQMKGKQIDLSLGFSHPVLFDIPQGITIEIPAQTEIVVKGVDKQLVGQVAANIRSIRPPEPYKGKGVRYHDEQIILKQAKKK